MSAPSAFRSVIRKARKAHKCCECHNVINIGDRYQYSSGIWDGEPDSYKQCLGCGGIFTVVSQRHYEPYSDCGPHFEDLKGFLENEIDAMALQSLNDVADYYRVSPKALNQLLKMEVVCD